MSELRLRAGANTHWKLKDGECVVVDFATGNYFVLDDVCSFFWKRMMDRAYTINELVDATLEEYDASREEVAENVEKFFRYLLSEKLAENA